MGASSHRRVQKSPEKFISRCLLFRRKCQKALIERAETAFPKNCEKKMKYVKKERKID
jgi:hypothetical protein